MKEYVAKNDVKKWISKNVNEPNGALKVTFVNNQIDKLPSVTKADIYRELVDKLKQYSIEADMYLEWIIKEMESEE